jgi:putative salt-induced outer membrane protein
VKRIVSAVILACALPATAKADGLPDPIRAMVQTAIDSNDPVVIASVASVAKRTAPDGAAEVDAMVAEFNTRLSARKAAEAKAAADRIAQAGPFSLWKGSVELGGSRSTGNSRVVDIYSGLELTRVGLRWTHKLSAHAEYQETSGAPSAERASLAYEPQLKLDPVFYGFALSQYEHDRFLGYRNRYTVGAGVGVSAVRRPELTIGFDAGPAARVTDFYDAPLQRRLAARGSLHLKWLPSPTLTFTQEAAIYLQRGDTTAKSSTGLETTLFGPLKARVSFDAQYEGDAPAGQSKVDTTSRASLVYGF